MDADQIGATHQRTMNILGDFGSDKGNALLSVSNAAGGTIFGEMGQNSAMNLQINIMQLFGTQNG